MYDGKYTKELEKLIEEHTRLFGYDPDTEITVEYGYNYKDYVADLKLCIKHGIDIIELNKRRPNHG